MKKNLKELNKFRSGSWPDYLSLGKHCIQRHVGPSRVDASPLEHLDIEGAGVSDLAGTYDISRSDFFCHVVFFTLSGSGRLQTPDQEISMRRGDLMIVPSGCQARYFINGREWQIVWFDIRDTERWHQLRNKKVTVRKAGSELPLLRQTMDNLYREVHGNQIRSPELASLLAQQIGIYLERELTPRQSTSDEAVIEQLNRLFRTVDNRLQFNWTVSNMAKEINVSPPHLYLLCRKYLGSTPCAR